MYKLSIVFLFSFITYFVLNGQCYPDRHNTNWRDGWLSCQSASNPNSNRGPSHWIQYDLGDVYVLGQTHFWNSNIPDSTNRGFQEVSLDYSMDAQTWTEWGSFVLPEADASLYYEGVQGPSLNGIAARYVLLTANSNYGGDCYGLSEVKFGVQNSPVPVEIVSFEVECNKDYLSELRWKSSTEINNQYFSIEKSLDGRNWELLETVEGKGTKFEESNYSLMDKEYLVGSKFYRLSQTDFNGRTAVIDIREIECGTLDRNIYVSPNPFSDQVNVRLVMPASSSFSYVLMDALGRLVKEGSIVSANPIVEFEINTSDLFPGSYMLNIIYPKSKEQVKLVKL